MVAIFYAATIISGCNSDKTSVTIKNMGEHTLRSVTVYVTGNSYAIGNIQPNASKSIQVSVAGESHIELTQINGPRLVLDVYLEPGYGGEIYAIVAPDSVLSVKQDQYFVPF